LVQKGFEPLLTGVFATWKRFMSWDVQKLQKQFGPRKAGLLQSQLPGARKKTPMQKPALPLPHGPVAVSPFVALWALTAISLFIGFKTPGYTTYSI
jgi:hypothetical protein